MSTVAVRELTMSQALNEALREEMTLDQSTLVIGEDIARHGGLFKVTAGLLDEFGPQRVIDSPISEAAITGFGAGGALIGCRPVVELQISDFVSLAMDQLVNHAAKWRYMSGGQVSVPLVVRGPISNAIGMAAQHSQTLEAWFVHAPGLIVIMPSNAYDAKGLLKSAIRDDNPVLFLEKRLLYSRKANVPAEDYLVPIGVADVKREGKDVTIVTYCKGLELSMKAAEDLAKEGIEVEIVDLRTLRPLDMEPVLESFKKTNRAVVVEEGWKSYGVGSEISSRIYEEAFDYVDAPIRRVAQKEVPLPYNRTLEQAALPQVHDIIDAVKEVLK